MRVHVWTYSSESGTVRLCEDCVSAGNHGLKRLVRVDRTSALGKCDGARHGEEAPPSGGFYSCWDEGEET